MSGELEWKHRDLGELVDVLDSRRIPLSAKERAARLGDVPYYGATGQVGWIDDALFDEPLLLLGEDGVQFFDRDKPKAYAIAGRAWVNNHAHVLRARVGLINQRFLLHYLNWFDYTGFANGTTRLKLTQAAMRRISVVFPPLDEQQRIVQILEDHFSRLDAASGLIETAGRRLSAWQRSSLDSLVRDDADGAIRLDFLIERVEAGRSFGSSAPPAAPDEWGIIKVSAMTWGEFRQDENKVVPADKVDPRYEISSGDLLLSRANTTAYVGAAVLVEKTRPLLLLSDKSLRLVPKSGIDARWLAAVLAAPSTRRQISALATGTKDSMRNISQQNLLSVSVPRATLAQQERVAARVSALHSSVSHLDNQLTVARTRFLALRRSLLTAAFSGLLLSRSLDAEIVKEMAGV